MVQSQTEDSPFSSQADSICAAALVEIARHGLCKSQETTGEGCTSSIGSTIGGRVATRAATHRILQSQTNPQLTSPSPAAAAAVAKGDLVENQAPGGSSSTSGPPPPPLAVAKSGSSSSQASQKRFFQIPAHVANTNENENQNNNDNYASTSNAALADEHPHVKHPPHIKKHSTKINDQVGPATSGSQHYHKTTPPPPPIFEIVVQKQNQKTSGSCSTTVKSASQWHQDPVWDYRMSSPSRGYCLIINNVEFSLGLFEKRKGSDKDAYRFKEIFKQLGFEVDCKRNATAEKMKNAFKQKSTLCSSKHDALVVILLSHGTESGVYGSDGLEVELNDILSYFDNKKCKAMQNKPKVFIVQACRGRRADYGVQHETQTFFSQPDTQLTNTQPGPSQLTQANPSQATRLPRWAELDNKSNPTRTDMILCFASQSGFVSTRDEDEGSWLGASLAHYLATEAHQRHLHEILQMVSRDVRKRCSSDGLKQVLEITSIGFDRNLYFNPGLSIQTTTMTRASAARSKS